MKLLDDPGVVVFAYYGVGDMNPSRQAILLALVLIAPLCFFCVPLDSLEQSGNSVDLSPAVIDFMRSYEVHSIIDINNDTHFDDVASNENWDGYGNETHPYIIEGYNITDDLTCIEITDVSRYFVIRNCMINSSTGPTDPGIVLLNVSNARVENTVVAWHTHAIYADDCPTLVIDNCTITKSNAITIWILYSNDTVISNCDVYENPYRITIQDSVGVTLENNTIHDNGWEGVLVASSDSTVLKNNTVYNSEGEGIILSNSDFCEVTKNTVYDNGASGILVSASDNCTITENRAFGNSHTLPTTGIHVQSSHNGTISDNILYDNFHSGIYLHSSDNWEVLGNDIYNNSVYGIYGWSADNVTVYDNDIWLNGWDTIPSYRAAVNVQYSYRWNITGNKIFDNLQHGIRLDIVYDMIIADNDILDNGWSDGGQGI
ncbi:MAG: right-handed parallel beta-helix repeat-containing protein, partial [Candidatus Thorarchaeota archaeon]